MTKRPFRASAISLHHRRDRPSSHRKGRAQPALVLLLSLLIAPLWGCSDAENAKPTETVSAPTTSTPSAMPPANTVKPEPEPMAAIDPSQALLMAADRGDEEAMQRLLDAGVDVHATDADGSTALMLAAGKGYATIVRLLLAAGAQANATSADGSTPLMAAARAGHLEVAEILVNAGANASATNQSGVTALAIAQRNGHAQIAKLLAPKIRPARESVVEAQRLLTVLGYDTGPIDGIWGPKTATAIRAYQKEMGLPVDGLVSTNLIQHASTLEQQILAEQEREPEHGG